MCRGGGGQGQLRSTAACSTAANAHAQGLMCGGRQHPRVMAEPLRQSPIAHDKRILMERMEKGCDRVPINTN
jgi:hypothetical protein